LGKGKNGASCRTKIIQEQGDDYPDVHALRRRDLLRLQPGHKEGLHSLRELGFRKLGHYRSYGN
jgi:hypothetical protein